MHTDLIDLLSNMATASSQSRTPFHLAGQPERSALATEFIGKHLRELRTPALVIDRAVFAKNCAKMHTNAAGYGAAFRAHLKTHKVGVPIAYGPIARFALIRTIVRLLKGQGFSLCPVLPLLMPW